MHKTVRVVSFLAYAYMLATIAIALPQQTQKPLTNDDVLKMVQSGLPESTILSVIQASATKFDVAPIALAALQKAGVSPNVVNSMMSAPSKSQPPGAAEASAQGAGMLPTTTMPPTSASQQNSTPSSGNTSVSSRDPAVTLLPASATATAIRQVVTTIPIEKAQLVQTKSKASSISGMAGDSVTSYALQGAVNTASSGVMAQETSAFGSTAVSQAGGVFDAMLSRRKPEVSYVWAVPGPNSMMQATSNLPSFSVDFSGWMYVTLDAFEPAIVRLTQLLHPMFGGSLEPRTEKKMRIRAPQPIGRCSPIFSRIQRRAA